MSARYEISADHVHWLDVRDPHGNRNTVNQPAAVALIRQQSADIAELSAVVVLLTHKVICCGVAASHPNAALTTTGAYADKWDSPQAESVRKLRAERDQLRAELAAAVAERDEWKECAMSNLDERDQLRAQLAEYENAPTVAVVWFARNKDGVACSGLDYTDLPPIGTELIARKVKK